MASRAGTLNRWSMRAKKQPRAARSILRKVAADFAEAFAYYESRGDLGLHRPPSHRFTAVAVVSGTPSTTSPPHGQ